MPVIEEIMKEARMAGASDVHIMVGIPPKMRINGSLITMNYPKMTAADTLNILLEIMTEVQCEQFEERGEYDLSFQVPGLGRCRVNAYRQQGVVAMALRLVETQVPSPENLGIPVSVLQLAEKKSGLVLVTGFAGSGKSTTMAVLVDMINNTREAHVITLESPIEYLHQHKMAIISQREIGTDSKSYGSAMKAALREDPDVILIGEMNDAETAGAAICAAETGHLVLAEIPAADGAAAIERIVELFPLHGQQIRMRLAKVLKAVVFQQLSVRPDGRGQSADFEVMLSGFMS